MRSAQALRGFFYPPRTRIMSKTLAMAHETLASLAWGDALNRYAIQLGLELSAPEGG